MEDWILGLLGLASNPIRDLTKSIMDRILSVWSTITTFLGYVRSALISLRSTAASWITAQIQHAVSVATTFRWFMFTFIPRQIGTAIGDAKAFLVARIQDAIATARADLITAQDWLKGLIDKAMTQFDKLQAWALARIGDLRTDVGRLLGHVFGVLATPERLADWAIDAIVTDLVKWVKDHAVALGRRLVAERAQILMASTEWLEDLISRIL